VSHIFSPVITNQQHRHPLSHHPHQQQHSPRENGQRPNKQVLTPARRARHPSSSLPPDHQRGHDLTAGLPGTGSPGVAVLTRRRLPGPSLPQRQTRQLLLGGQHQLSTLSGTDGNQPGITGKRPTAINRSSTALSRSAPAP
jgi:hypothetical protein